MTYEEIQEMNILQPYCFETDREEEWYKAGLVDGADVAYNQGTKDTINKACEWWGDELIYPSMTEEEVSWYKSKINAFRKAMEEEK